jgi:hypothetical protein
VRDGEKAGAEVVESPLGPSTLQLDEGVPLAEGRHAAATWVRRGALTLLALAVAAGLTSYLGVHTGTVSSAGSEWDLTLRYPQVARPGLDVAWQATVRHPGGLGNQVTLAVSGDYFNIYETQGFHPEPSEETRDGRVLYLTFTAPPGNTFVVDFDAYIQPASQAGRSATLAVVDPQTLTPLTSVDFRTRLLP